MLTKTFGNLDSFDLQLHNRGMSSQEQATLGISNPGKNRQLISPSEAVRRDPEMKFGWTLRVRHQDGHVQEIAPGTDWEAVSRFGAVRSAVVTSPDGSPSFDRPRYDEAPSINIIAYGRDKKTSQIKIGMISQARPHADNDFELESTDAPRFAQIPMGFLDKVIGKDLLEHFETAGEGAARETTEETGARVIRDISYPEYPKHYANPTFAGTSANLAFVEVDLDEIDKMKIDRTEGIFQADYIPLDQLIQDIKAGENEHGYTRMATANSALLIFLSSLSSIQNAESNEAEVAQARRDTLIDQIAEARLRKRHKIFHRSYVRAKERAKKEVHTILNDGDDLAA